MAARQRVRRTRLLAVSDHWRFWGKVGLPARVVGQHAVLLTPDLADNLRLFETLLDHARVLGVWPPENPLEGIEVDICLAKAVNAVVRG